MLQRVVGHHSRQQQREARHSVTNQRAALQRQMLTVSRELSKASWRTCLKSPMMILNSVDTMPGRKQARTDGPSSSAADSDCGLAAAGFADAVFATTLPLALAFDCCLLAAVAALDVDAVVAVGLSRATAEPSTRVSASRTRSAVSLEHSQSETQRAVLLLRPERSAGLGLGDCHQHGDEEPKRHAERLRTKHRPRSRRFLQFNTNKLG